MDIESISGSGKKLDAALRGCGASTVRQEAELKADQANVAASACLL
jgi:hypothetical protein